MNITLVAFVTVIILLILFSQTNSIKQTAENCKYTRTKLCDIMANHGSDKSTNHNYTSLYYDLFESMKNERLNIFEVGLGTKNPNILSNMAGGNDTKTGGSLRGWKEFFPNAMIYGADIDQESLFTDDRIQTYYVDQLNPDSIKSMWNKIPEDFDIIIDDGLHTSDANRTFLVNSYHKLRDGGIYIIEDITPDELYKHQSDIEIYKKLFSYVKLINLPSERPDNKIILLQK